MYIFLHIYLVVFVFIINCVGPLHHQYCRRQQQLCGSGTPLFFPSFLI
jgi:hypothetical protein